MTQEIDQMLQGNIYGGPGNMSRGPGNVAGSPGNKLLIQEMTSLAKNISISIDISLGNQLLFQGNGQLGPGNMSGGPGNDVYTILYVVLKGVQKKLSPFKN